VEVWKGWKRIVLCNQREKLIDTNSIKNKRVTLKCTENVSGPLSKNTKNQQIIKNDIVQNEISSNAIESVDYGDPDTGMQLIADSGEECKRIMKENMMGDKLKDYSGWCDDSSVCIEQTAQDLKDGDRKLVGVQSTSEITDKTRAECDRNEGVCTGKTFSVDDKNVSTGQVDSTITLTGISATVTEGRETINDVVSDETVKLNTNGTDVSSNVEVTYSNVGKKLEIVENRTVAGTQEIMGTTTKRTGFFGLFRSPVLRQYNLIMVFVW
jgi:hypothetical protein